MIAIPLLLENFFTYSLTLQHLQQAAVIFALVLFFICSVAFAIFSHDKRRLSWTLTLVNSFLLSTVGVVYMYIKISTFKENFFLFGNNGIETIYSIDNVSALLCLWFAMVNIFDLVFGLLCYRKYLDPLTAYVHHTIFVYVMYFAITGNGIFLSAPRFAIVFGYAMIEEFPTFLLALGAVFPFLRTDAGFGVSFFVLRILYHGYLFSYSAFLGSGNHLMCIFTLTMVMHIFWFYSWFSKYGTKLLRGTKDIKKI